MRWRDGFGFIRQISQIPKASEPLRPTRNGSSHTAAAISRGSGVFDTQHLRDFFWLMSDCFP